LEKVARLEGHEARVLDMAISPDKSTIVTAGADETLRIWRCFAVDEERKKYKAKREVEMRGGRSVFQTLMR
jgi:WD40 repeat protein